MKKILSWVFLVALALHTGIGAIWKFSHTPESTMPSLATIPPGLWVGMGVVELLLALAMIAPAFRPAWSVALYIALAGIAAEMLFFIGVHLASGHGTETGPMIYWAVVIAWCAAIAVLRRMSGHARQ